MPYEHTVTTEELSRRFLPSRVENAFPEVDLEVREAGMGFELEEIRLKGLRVYASVRGLYLAIAVVVVSLVSLITRILLAISQIN